MQTFVYERPTTLAEAVALLDTHGSDARVLAGAPTWSSGCATARPDRPS